MSSFFTLRSAEDLMHRIAEEAVQVLEGMFVLIEITDFFRHTEGCFKSALT
jgi:hypothetical protein